jgi:hypothetical protein
MSAELRPITRVWERSSDQHARLTIWPVEGDLFGIDVRWGSAAGNRRATVVARLLQDAGIRGRLTQAIDGAWEVRVGPVPGSDVARVIDEFVW